MLKKLAILSLSISLAFLSAPANARQGTQAVGIPVVTFVVDGVNGLRPVMGIAGSASIGEPLGLGFPVIQAAVPADPDYVLAGSGEGTWPVLVRFHGGTARIQSLDSLVNNSPAATNECAAEDADRPWNARARRCTGAQTPWQSSWTIDRIALSPAGSSAALFSKADQRIYVVGNLPDSPTLVGKFEVAALGPLTAIAIGDTRTVLAGVSDGSSGALFLLTLNQIPHRVASMPSPAVIRFYRGSNDAVIADDVENTIYKLANRQLFAVAAPQDGISTPVGIGFSNDNQTLFVANAGTSSVTTIKAHGAVAEPVPCHCAVTGLHPTSTDSVFRLTDFTGGPVLLFDGSGAAPRLLFARVGSGF